MISTVKEIYNHIEKAEVISKELTDILLELDTTNSRVTQASLNDILMTLYNRIKSEEKTKFEVTDSYMNCEEFINWLYMNITTYSYNMFMESMGFK